jgi:DNA-binding beta-propeller fold protein YncE/negative regulator of sigma E activity
MTRTAELTAKLLDGTLSEAESAELDALMESDPVAEVEHLALLELEAELRGLRTDFDLSEQTLAQVESVHVERTTGAVMSEIATNSAPSWAPRPAQLAPRRRRAWAAVAALAACAAAVLVGLWLGTKGPEPQPDGGTAPEPLAFAKLARKSGAVEVLSPAGETIPTDEGGDLPAGFTVRTGDDSLAVIELLHEKARVEIEPDSIVRFAGDLPESAGKPRLFLAAGQLTAAVTPRPDNRPLVVGTPVAEVFARGATFVVSSAGPDSARVDIKHGKVELVRAAAPKPVPVGPGGAAIVHSGFDPMDIVRSPATNRMPKRLLAAPGTRDAVFSPDGNEVWVATARAFGRWTPSGGLTEMGFFFPRKGNDGVAAFSRDRKFLLTFRGERDDRVSIRRLPDGGEQASLNARPSDPRLWTLAPHASWLAVADPRPNNKRVRVLDVATSDERFVREFDDQITSLAASPDAKTLAVAVHAIGRGVSNKVVVYDAQTSDRLYALSVLKRPVTAMTFSPDGRTLAVGYNGVVQLWDVRALELSRSIAGFERPLTCLNFSPDGKRLAAGTPDGHVWVWDTETGRQTQLIEVGGRGVRAVSFSPNGKQLVTVATLSSVAVWDVADPPPATDLQ